MIWRLRVIVVRFIDVRVDRETDIGVFQATTTIRIAVSWSLVTTTRTQGEAHRAGSTEEETTTRSGITSTGATTFSVWCVCECVWSLARVYHIEDRVCLIVSR